MSGAALVQAADDLALVGTVFDSASGHLNAQHARIVSGAVWMLDNVSTWQGDGVWTPEAYVRWRTGISQATASKVVDIARRSKEFPDCVAAMERGELSLDQIAPIARHAPGWCDAQMAGLAPRCTVAQITKMAKEYPWDHHVPAKSEPECAESNDNADDTPSGVAADGDGVESTRPCSRSISGKAEAPDEAWFGWDDHGRFRLSLNVGADSGMVIEQALAESRDTLFHAGDPSVDTVDAVIEMAQRSIDSIDSPERRSRYRANVFIGADGTVTDARGRSVPIGSGQRITCDALLSPVVVTDGVPVSVGRSQHIVPDRTRRLVEHRDGGCKVPGCNSDRFVEVHHIVHWSHGGPTDTWNLICLCPKHHRLHHQGRLGITGNADIADPAAGGVRFSDVDGKLLAESGARPEPPGAPPPAISGTWRHPLGERLDFRWLYFNDDPNRPAPLGPEPLIY